MRRVLSAGGAFLVVTLLIVQPVVAGDLTLLGQFNPSKASGLCGLGFDQAMGNVWVYDCDAAVIQSYSRTGTFLIEIPRPGEAADDVDVEVAPETILFGAESTSLPAGTLLFINGETGPAEIYALDKSTGDVLATLNTDFGLSHVVGGAYHAGRDTFFLVQDRRPSGTSNDSLVAEIDPGTGDVLNSFQIAGDFSVDYGDIEISTETGNLFVVSSDESTIGEFTPAGAFVRELALPSVGSLSGIGFDDRTGEIWVSSTSGTVSRLGGLFQPESFQITIPFISMQEAPVAPPALERVSVGMGGAQANGTSVWPSLSTDARYVAFKSFASNLVSGDTNGVADVFVYDRQAGQTTRVSVASDGMQADAASDEVAISGNGRYVAFSSVATNLVAGDTNGVEDVFVHDRETGQTTRVSVASDGTQGNGSSRPISIGSSEDGRFIAFTSQASNLVGGDTNEDADVFVHDRETGQTTRVSVASDGTQGNFGSGHPSLSADGRYVAFGSQASNLVAGIPHDYHVFVHDRETGQTTLASVSSDGSPGTRTTLVLHTAISGDGRVVAFTMDADGLAPGDTQHDYDVFAHERETRQTTQLTVAPDGSQGDDNSLAQEGLGISADGRYVAYYSPATNLFPGDNNFFCPQPFRPDRSNCEDIFVWDRQTGQNTRVSVTLNGSEANGGSRAPSLSADGRFVAFQSSATNLVPGDTNDATDIFVRDLQATAP